MAQFRFMRSIQLHKQRLVSVSCRRGILRVDVITGLVPVIHAFFLVCQNVDGRVKPGHDAWIDGAMIASCRAT